MDMPQPGRTEDRSVDEEGTKKVVLMVTTLVAFLSPFGLSSVNIALPSIGKTFHMDAILLSWVTTAYLLASATFLVPFGKLADLYGRKKIFTYGILTFTLASLGSSISPSAVLLVCFRILQGIGAAAMYCVGAAILTSVFPPRQLGKVLGINVAAVYLGLSAGPFGGGWLTQHLGWRSIFLVNVLLGSILLLSIFLKLKREWLEAKDEKFDLQGSIIYSMTLLLLMVGFSNVSKIAGAGLVVLGALGMFAFVKWETKAENPVLEIGLFRNNRIFAYSNLAALINYSATFAVTFLMSLYLQYIKGLAPDQAGMILVSQPMMQALFSPLSGRFSDKIEPRIVASTGMGLTAVALFLFSFLDEKTTIGFMVGCLMLLGLGLALFSSPNMNAVMGSVERKSYGVASGTLGTMRAMGQVLSMGTTILIFSMTIGKVQITPDIYPLFLRGVRWAFVFFTALCGGGILASLARGRVR
jgi:EmrB/QacA subfamily drug resistance transporter